MSDYSLYVILLGISLLCGCSSHQQGGGELSSQSLVGRWESDVVPGEWGRSITQLMFGGDGKVSFRAVFVDESPPKELAHEGNYKLVGNMLTSDAMNKGKPLRAWLDRGDLMLQIDDEAPGRYHRVK